MSKGKITCEVEIVSKERRGAYTEVLRAFGSAL